MRSIQGNTLGKLDFALVSEDLGTLEAFTFAQVAHGDQKYGNEPYVSHLENTLEVFLTYADFYKVSFNDAIITAISCVLHDVIEDTDVTKEELSFEFGPEVAETVWNCTGVGGNRRLKQESIRKKCLDRTQSRVNSCCVKLCDRITNIEQGIKERSNYHLQKYLNENQAFLPIAYIGSSCGLELLSRYNELIVQADNLLKELDDGREKT